MARRKPVDPVVKQLLGWDADADDKEFLQSINAATKRVCKPCWELKYCPYGPLVEDFPLPPPTRAQSEEHNVYLRNALDTGKLGSGEDLDDGRREMFEQNLASYDPSHYPEHIPLEVEEMGCRVFGHVEQTRVAPQHISRARGGLPRAALAGVGRVRAATNALRTRI